MGEIPGETRLADLGIAGGKGREGEEPPWPGSTPAGRGLGAVVPPQVFVNQAPPELMVCWGSFQVEAGDKSMVQTSRASLTPAADDFGFRAEQS